MLRNYFTLYHLARELHELLVEGYVFEVFSQQRNEITISLITNKGDHLQLIVVTGHPKLCVYTREGLNRKQRNTVELMPEIAEKKISGVTIDPCDRIIRLLLEDHYGIILQLFSAKTAVLLQKNARIIAAFKQDVPASTGINEENAVVRPEILRSLELLVYDKTLFVERFRTALSKDTTENLRRMLPGFDRRLVRELLKRCDGTCRAEKIHDELAALFYELLDPLPSVLPEGENGPEFSILQRPPETSIRFETVLDALNTYSRKTWNHLKTRELVHDLGSKLRHKKAKIERELAHFQPEKIRQLADTCERNGHLIMANLYNPGRKKESITVPDIFTPSAPPRTIPLKAELTLQQNAAALFRKASKTREKIEGGIRRNTAIHKQKEALDKLIEHASGLSTPSEVRNFYETNRAVLKFLGFEESTKKEKKSLPFRKFAITQKAVLYVGKNARNNEQLTFSFAKPNDIWLHARGTAGSHCILRGATMQNTSEIRRAAEIAAFYSTAKHSELVPVQYTEKKFVRRAKNMPPGQVLPEREKVIMVRPSQEG